MALGLSASEQKGQPMLERLGGCDTATELGVKCDWSTSTGGTGGGWGDHAETCSSSEDCGFY